MAICGVFARSPRAALAAYGMKGAQLEFIEHFEWKKYLFKVRVPRPDRSVGGERWDNGRFLLRIYQDEMRSPPRIRSELAWLRAIVRDTDIVVPQPVANLAGDDCTNVAGVPGLSGVYHCCLTHWVRGRPYLRKTGPGAEAMRKVGGLMARLHVHSQRFKPPRRCEFGRWDYQGLFGRASRFYPADGVSGEATRLFRSAMRRARTAMADLGTGPDVFGLIHGDMIQINYIFHNDQARAIDFGDCGYGHFLYDIGVTLLMLRAFDSSGGQRAAFIKGYREIRPLSSEHEQLLNVFVAARAVALARWLMGNDHLRIPGACTWVRQVVKWLKVSLNG